MMMMRAGSGIQSAQTRTSRSLVAGSDSACEHPMTVCVQDRDGSLWRAGSALCIHACTPTDPNAGSLAQALCLQSDSAQPVRLLAELPGGATLQLLFTMPVPVRYNALPLQILRLFRTASSQFQRPF
eukprot:2602804-Rhodomonas_salina.2